MVVKFGTEEETEGPLLRAKFQPHKGIGPPKLKLLLRFDQNVEWNINAPQGRIICAIFTKFAEFVPRFYVKISLDLLKGYGVMGVLT